MRAEKTPYSDVKPVAPPPGYGNQQREEPGVKFDAGKPRFDLIPAEAMLAVAQHFARGAEKYGDRNWENGMSWGRVFRAMMTHAWKWWLGEEMDEEGFHHLDAVIWGAMVLRAYVSRPKLAQFDDRPKETN